MKTCIIKLGKGNKRKSGNYIKNLTFGGWKETSNVKEAEEISIIAFRYYQKENNPIFNGRSYRIIKKS